MNVIGLTTQLHSKIVIVALLILCPTTGCAERCGSDRLDGSKRVWSLNSETGEIAGVIPGMALATLRDVGFPFEGHTVIIEGDEYAEQVMFLDHATTLRLLANEEGKVYRVSTDSPYVKDERGMGVNSSVDDLSRNYPSGKLVFLHEGGRQVKFFNGSNVVFVFDASALENQCFGEDRGMCNLPESYGVSTVEVFGFRLPSPE